MSLRQIFDIREIEHVLSVAHLEPVFTGLGGFNHTGHRDPVTFAEDAGVDEMLLSAFARFCHWRQGRFPNIYELQRDPKPSPMLDVQTSSI